MLWYNFAALTDDANTDSSECLEKACDLALSEGSDDVTPQHIEKVALSTVLSYWSWGMMSKRKEESPRVC